MYPIGAVDSSQNKLLLAAVMAAIAGNGLLATVDSQQADAFAGVSFTAKDSVTNPGANAVLAYVKNTDSAKSLVISRTRILAGVADTIYWQVDDTGTAAGGAALTPVNHLAGGDTFANEVGGAEVCLSGSTGITGVTASAAKAASVAYVAAATPAVIEEVIVIPPGHSAALVCLAGGTETFNYAFNISVRTPGA